MKENIGQGDSGKTSLLGGGTKVPKDSPQVTAYGSLDELVSFLGLVKIKTRDTKLRDLLEKIQDHLFRLEAHISASVAWQDNPSLPHIDEKCVKFLEDTLEKYEKDLPKLENFVLPGGSELSALLHVARAEARRVERILVHAEQAHKLHPQAIPYVNRLSDVLFTLARWINFQNKTSEKKWVGVNKRDIDV